MSCLSDYLNETEMEMERIINFDDPIFNSNNNHNIYKTKLNYRNPRIPINAINDYDVQELTANFLNNNNN